MWPEPTIGERIDALTDPISYETYLQTLEKFMYILVRAMFVPGCEIIRFYSWSPEKDFEKVVLITGCAWIKKGRQEGQIRIRWEYEPQIETVAVTINNHFIIRYSWPAWMELIKADESTWTETSVHLLLRRDLARFSTFFPDLDIKLTQLV